jgi:hypothetical protein
MVECIPYKPYRIKPLPAFRGHCYQFSALTSDPIPEPVCSFDVTTRNEAMALTRLNPSSAQNSIFGAIEKINESALIKIDTSRNSPA